MASIVTEVFEHFIQNDAPLDPGDIVIHLRIVVPVNGSSLDECLESFNDWRDNIENANADALVRDINGMEAVFGGLQRIEIHGGSDGHEDEDDEEWDRCDACDEYHTSDEPCPKAPSTEEQVTLARRLADFMKDEPELLT